jgi:hypothetical protein
MTTTLTMKMPREFNKASSCRRSLLAHSACLLSALMAIACSSDDNAGPGTGTAGASLAGAGGTGGGTGRGTGGVARADAADGNGGGDSADTGLGGGSGMGGTGGTDIIDAGGERVFDTDDGGIPPDAAVGSCAAANWNVSANVSNPGNPPINAVDGNPATRWSTGGAQGPGQYYEIDFRGYVQLSQITINSAGSAGDYARGIELAVSDDDVDFSRVIAAVSVDVPPLNDIITIDFPLHSARFLRLNETGAAGNWWSIHELTLACRVPGAGVDPLLCGGDAGVRDAGDAGGRDPFARANWTATISGLPDGGVSTAVSNAFDSDITTRWTTGAPQAGTEVFKLDLGSVACISQVLITTAGPEYANAYRLTLSVDDVTYFTQARGTGQNLLQVTFAPHFARYIRIEQTGTTTVNPWSINEIAIRP